MDDWNFPHYVCSHGVRGGMPFLHIVGPTTSATGGPPPVPPCRPVLVSPEPEAVSA